MPKPTYPATLEIKYPTKLDRTSTFFRLILSLPIVILLTILVGTSDSTFGNETTNTTVSSGGVVVGLAVATGLVILFRQRYPKWWFDFSLELHRFSMRVQAYLLLLTDKYPSTVDKQAITMELAYPNVKQDLNRWMPLFKWILAFPHYIILFFLTLVAFIGVIIAWFAILFTGKYPRGIFNFVVGVNRWNWRVSAYMFLLATDKYPPFSLD